MKQFLLLLIISTILSAKDRSAIHICTLEATSLISLNMHNKYVLNGRNTIASPETIKYIQIINDKFTTFIEIGGKKSELHELGRGINSEVYFYSTSDIGILFHTIHEGIDGGFKWTFQSARSHISDNTKIGTITKTYSCTTVHNTLFK